MVWMGILDCEQWVFGAHDKISSIECERCISGARDLRFHVKVLSLAPAAVSNGVSKSLAMAILGCMFTCTQPTTIEGAGCSFGVGCRRMAQTCAVRSKRRRDILIGRANPGVQEHSLDKGIRQAAVRTCIRICEVTLSFQLVPVNIIVERSILSRIAQSIHSNHYFGRG